MKESKKVIAIKIEPHKRAKVIEQGTELFELQNAVDGYIELAYPFQSSVCIVCNEEGKITEIPNRLIADEKTGFYDVIYGTFLIMRSNNGGFQSLTERDIKKYLPLFDKPHLFIDRKLIEVEAPIDTDDLRFRYIHSEN